MKSFAIVIGVSLAALVYGFDMDTLPQKTIDVMNGCCDKNGMNKETIIDDCMFVDDENEDYCCDFIFCMGHDLGFIEQDGTLKVNEAIAECEQYAKSMGADINVKEMLPIIQECVDNYNEQLSAGQMEHKMMATKMYRCFTEKLGDKLVEMM